MVQLSELNDIAVAPKPVERQRVSTALRVFSEKTCAALMHHPEIKTSTTDTVVFIQKVLKFWKIVNVKAPGLDKRLNDVLRAPITDPDDERLTYLQEFGNMALQMAGKQGSRVKQLSQDTAKALYYTCNGLVDMTRHLLYYQPTTMSFLGSLQDPLKRDSGSSFPSIKARMEGKSAGRPLRTAKLVQKLDHLDSSPHRQHFMIKSA